MTVSPDHPTDGSLLLVTHVGIKHADGRNLLDDQTAAGIAQWTRAFSRVGYYGIALTPEQERAQPARWVDIATHPGGQRCELVALPNAYRLSDMIRNYTPVRALLAAEISRHEHLCFTLGGLIGDWPAIAALEAIRQKRRFAAWFDRVEPDVIARTLAGAPLKRQIKEAIALPLMEQYHRYLLRRSSVALLQGGDTFAHYGHWSNNAHCIYDTHTSREDEILDTELVRKQNEIMGGRPLKIIYVGRAAAMKGPDDWIKALALLHKAGVAFEATWLGDGPALEHMRDLAREHCIADRVRFAGFVGDHKQVLEALRASDLLMFCHKTAESPRCLIEAVVCGCAIVGYESDYVTELARTGGGHFVGRDDIAALATAIEGLSRERGQLADLVAKAAATGRRFNEDSVYAHRADLMRTFG